MAQEICKEIYYRTATVSVVDNGYTVQVHHTDLPRHKTLIFSELGEVVRWLKDNLIKPEA